MRKFGAWVRDVVLGRARDLSDQHLFHKVSLIAVFAWVGLGADGLSSSCYGPEEAFKALGTHTALAPAVALASVLTIAIICISYAQIIALFPAGGGGYVVASKLLSPTAGVVSGCALLVDYVLTIAISVASGADALFSLLPAHALPWKLPFALAGVALLTLLNLRGIRESVLIWVPVFFLFLATHGFAILYALLTHAADAPAVAADMRSGWSGAHAELGLLGLLALLVRAYSVGAGTYTGIEAVSNGLSILREPRAATGRRTMVYMGVSLAATVAGLLVAYVLYRVEPVAGKTLNAVLFTHVTAGWPHGVAQSFVAAAMIAATALLFIAAQAGFLDGPRVLANMALDRWFPARFASLSDRLVARNGILLMGGTALAVLAITRGAVGLLVVLYSINVFITFSISQLGMVRHWWSQRATDARWRRKLAVSGLGFTLTSSILVMLSVMKFHDGGWMTLVVTTLLIALAYGIRAHYRRVRGDLARLDALVTALEAGAPGPPPPSAGQTAVVLVNGYNGLGLHTVLAILRTFPSTFGRFVFVQAGAVDAGNFKGAQEIERLRAHVAEEANRYLVMMHRHGYAAEAFTDIGAEVVETLGALAARVREQHPAAVFFGGQLVFAEDNWWVRLLHNHVVFAVQRLLFRRGMPFLILPIRV